MLHDQEHRARVFAHVVERADVGMRQAGDSFGLTLEAALAIRISGGLGGEDFDRDGAIEAGVQGLVDFTHPPGANQAEDLVRTQPRADVEGHKEGLLAHTSIRLPRQGIGKFLPRTLGLDSECAAPFTSSGLPSPG